MLFVFWLSPDIFEDLPSLATEVSIFSGRADRRKLLASMVLRRLECSLTLLFDPLPESTLRSDLLPFALLNFPFFRSISRYFLSSDFILAISFSCLVTIWSIFSGSSSISWASIWKDMDSPMPPKIMSLEPN